MALSCRDPIPVPEKVRKPLTAVKEFNLNLDHRAEERAEFDQKVKMNQSLYFIAKRYSCSTSVLNLYRLKKRK